MRDGSEEDCLRFLGDGHKKKKWGTVISSAWQYWHEGGE